MNDLLARMVLFAAWTALVYHLGQEAGRQEPR